MTDGTNDGGINGYFIDDKSKYIYFFQSKFRATEENFLEKEIKLEEILKMDIDRILQGETTYENGNPYNSKILLMQNRINSIQDIGRYKYEVIVIANLKSITESKLRLLTSGFPCRVFDHKKCCSDLIFPIVSGTFYNNNDLNISVNLTNKNAGTKINYTVETELGICEITVLFVPTKEIGKLMFEYKNSILKYNPRSYLTLKEGSINEEIKNTIVRKTTNEFALYNNGITMLSDETYINERIGQRDKAQLSLKNPQIINGGQTAFTLSLIYEDALKGNINFQKKIEDKEVLLRIITFDSSTRLDEVKKVELINSISEATNKQNLVNNADRNSNNELLVNAQRNLFDDYGIFLERKRGEFYDGIRYGYILKSNIIDRAIFLKIAFSCLSYPVPPKNEKRLFTPTHLNTVLNQKANFKKYFFGCLCYSELVSSTPDFDIGNAKKVGAFSIIALCSLEYRDSLNDREIKTLSKNLIEKYLQRWKEFEDYAVACIHNSTYFRYNFNYRNKTVQLNSNFNKYYRSNNVAIDLNDFFNNGLPQIKEPNNFRKGLRTLDKVLKQNFVTEDVIKQVQKYLYADNWFDSTTRDMIIKKHLLSTNAVNNAIKLITSKEMGYYMKALYDN